MSLMNVRRSSAHLLGIAEVEVAPRFETDTEKGGLSPKMGPPKICILGVFLYFVFLSCLHSAVLPCFSLDRTSGIPYSPTP